MPQKEGVNLVLGQAKSTRFRPRIATRMTKAGSINVSTPSSTQTLEYEENEKSVPSQGAAS